MRELSSLTGFAGNPLERLSERRGDPDFLAQLYAHPDPAFVLLSGENPLIKMQDKPTALFTLHDIGAATDAFVLGLWDQRPILAMMLSPDHPPPLPVAHQTYGLRELAVSGLLAEPELAILGQAKSLLSWHAQHRFCAKCGTATQVALLGARRDCPSCTTQHFPRVDPVAIMLVTYQDQCLLARQPHFPENVYSCLAGFVEGGETLEEAVRREVFEEAGIQIGTVSYRASQPWPFPSSLMIGFEAKALSRKIKLDQTELEDARWFSRQEAMSMLEADAQSLRCPPPMTIAHHLIKAWCLS